MSVNAVLYLSPHADDVAFSAAGQVARDVAAGANVTLLTLFDAPDEAAFSDATARRAEDEAFARAFGVTLVRAPFADAIVRRPRYRAPRRLFAPLPADEAPLVDAVRALLQSHVDAGCRTLVAPLGVGGHVDHQIAHAAARAVAGAERRFYEDAPYVLTPYQLPRRLARLDAHADGARDATLLRGSVHAELSAAARAWLTSPLIEDRVRPALRKLAVATILTPEWTRWPRRSRVGRRRAVASVHESPTLAGDKLRAIACYPSQWRLFYRALDDWRVALERYGRTMTDGRAGIVERSWQLASD
ncbi:MAG TPA: PIG-L family deacetylase [Polyangia bacterium]|nr:PIG-L family deacetylase [Polyangia bacterium]